MEVGISSDPTDPELRPGFFPYGFWNEIRAQFRLAWPLCLSILFQYLLQPISIAFCGHLGKTELAAVALAISIIYLLVVSVGRGLAFGGDTFFAQTYGSENKKNVGVYLQKGLIFACLWTLPVIGILLNTETILLLIRQDPDVARITQDFITVFCPGTLAYCCFFMLMRYLLCQNKVLAILVTSCVSCGVNVLLNYLLVYRAGLGVIGSAMALALTYYLILFLLVAYIWLRKVYVQTWDGWSWQCLENWGEFNQITSFSMCMTLIYFISSEIGTFLGGILSPTDLSAFSMTFQVEGVSAMLPLGIGGACTARLGQFLGANKPCAAVNSARVALIFAVLVSAVWAVMCYGVRFYIPCIFTSDKKLIDFTASLLQLTCIFLLLEGFGVTAISIMRGTGRNGTGIIVMFIAYYLVTGPIGIPLMFTTHLGLYGLWLGYDIGIVVECVLFTIFILKFNWTELARKVSASFTSAYGGLKAVARSELGRNESSKIMSKTKEKDKTIDEKRSLLPRPASSQTLYRSPSAADILLQHHSTILLVSHSSFSQQQGVTRRLLVTRLMTMLLFLTPFLAGVFARIYVKLSPNDPSSMYNANFLVTNNTM